MNKVSIIGISSFARGGKNTFENILVDLLGEGNCYRASFARSLRLDVNEFCLSNFHISAFTQNSAEKEIIRGLLVGYAQAQRKLTNGEYFVDKLFSDLIEEGFTLGQDGYLYHTKYKYLTISDLRNGQFYNENRQNGDEIGFIRRHHGKIIHIKRYSLGDYYGEKIKIYQNAPNSEEELNDPIIQENADFKVEWEKINSSDFEELKTRLINYVRPVYEEILNLEKI